MNSAPEVWKRFLTVKTEKILTICAVCGTEIKFTGGTMVTLTMRDSETQF